MIDTRPTGRDVLAVGAVLLLALLLLLLPLLGRTSGAYLIVTTPEGSQRYSLAEDREWMLESHGITLQLSIRDGRACVRASDCPDHVCVQSGWIGRAGETVLCAPAGVMLTVKGGESDVDFVAG